MNRRSSRKNDYTANDLVELRKAYRFIPEGEDDNNNRSSTSSKTITSTWQERMARKYERELYREYVLADLTRVHLHRDGPIGLRWRTKAEVLQGKGESSCGNKHCPSYNMHAPPNLERPAGVFDFGDRNIESAAIVMQDEEDRLSCVEYGRGLHSYEVLFAYQEEGKNLKRAGSSSAGVDATEAKTKVVQKNELVKLCLCLRCAPLLFYHKGWVLGAKRARGEVGDVKGSSYGKRQASEDVDAKLRQNTEVKRKKKVEQVQKGRV